MFIEQFLSPKAPNIPQQVQINKCDIEALKKIIKTAYKSNIDLAEDAVTVPVDSTNAPDGTTSGWLISPNGNLFSIIAYGPESATLYLEFYANIKGEKGDTGATGATGPKGEKGDTGASGASITSMSLGYEITDVSVDSEGIHIDSNANVMVGDESREVPVTQTVPLVGSETVVLDENEHGMAEVHLSADLVGTISRSLMTPIATPSETKIVAIDTNGGQTNLNVGDGLAVENGELKATGGGSSSEVHLYMQNINIVINSEIVGYLNSQINVTLYSSSSAPPTTLANLGEYVQNLGTIPASGRLVYRDGTVYIVSGIKKAFADTKPFVQAIKLDDGANYSLDVGTDMDFNVAVKQIF